MERVQCFGTEDHLIGTWTPANVSSNVAVVLLNAGVVHRIGPHRLHVKLARALSAQGQASLRLDLSGLGDSGRVRLPAAYREQSCRDVQGAMDQLEHRFGIRRFALFGICSGAENALEIAYRDARVRGVYMVDGHAYPTFTTWWLRYALAVRAHGPYHAVRWLSRRLQTPRTTDASMEVPASDMDGRLSRDEFARQLQKLADRQVDTEIVYTGSVLDRYNHASQFRRTFGRHAFIEQVRCRYRPDLDHTLTALRAQQALIEEVLAWAQRIQRTPLEVPL